jgi:hypothetical protein
MSKIQNKNINKRIWGVECPECRRRMFSYYRHDFKYCGCENEVFVDGVIDYVRYGWKTSRPRKIYWSKKDGKYPAIVQPKDRWPY